MKAEAKYKYDKKDVEKVMTELHTKNHSAPEGMKWEYTEYYGEVHFTAVPIANPMEAEE